MLVRKVSRMLQKFVKVFGGDPICISYFFRRVRVVISLTVNISAAELLRV